MCDRDYQILLHARTMLGRISVALDRCMAEATPWPARQLWAEAACGANRCGGGDHTRGTSTTAPRWPEH